jgi:hypothetical protein
MFHLFTSVWVRKNFKGLLTVKVRILVARLKHISGLHSLQEVTAFEFETRGRQSFRLPYPFYLFSTRAVPGPQHGVDISSRSFPLSAIVFTIMASSEANWITICMRDESKVGVAWVRIWSREPAIFTEAFHGFLSLYRQHFGILLQVRTPSHASAPVAPYPSFIIFDTTGLYANFRH